jgi:hypothetical protein
MMIVRHRSLTLLTLGALALGACESPRITDGPPEADDLFPTLMGRSALPEVLQRLPGAPESVAGFADGGGAVGAVPAAGGGSDPTAFRRAAAEARLAPVQVAANGSPGGPTRLLWQHEDGARVLWAMDGTNWTGGYSVLGQVPPVWRIAAAADFNGDGNADVVWENTATGERAVWFLTAAGAWEGAFAMLPVVAPVWRIAAAADFTGDGKADLVWQDGAGSTVVWTMDGPNWGGSYSPLPLAPAEWQVAGAADFNGDGQTDLVWQNTTTGARVIWIMGGVTRLGFVTLPVVAPAWSIAAAADFNGDGKPDLVWQHTDGSRAIWLMNGLNWEGSYAMLPSVVPAWRIAAVLKASGAAAPGIASITPATLVPGGSATISGTGFGSEVAANTVTFAGVTATVTSATPTQLQVTVPCVPSGNVAVRVSVGGVHSQAHQHPLQVASKHTLAVGQSVVLTDAAQIPCNELVASGLQSRYVLAVYNTSTSPTSSTGFQISGTGNGSVGSDLALAAPSILAPQLPQAVQHAPFTPARDVLGSGAHDDAHHRLLEANRAEYAKLWSIYGRQMEAANRAGDANVMAGDVVPPPATKVIRVPAVTGSNFCSNYFEINATRVYYSGKLAIYEDDATPSGLRAANNPAMAAYYQKIGDEYNADMEPIIRNAYGDPLRRDAVTDNNGVLIAVFTPVINNQMAGIAGFVVSCDLFPNGASNQSSNFGEYFYAYMPTAEGTGFNSFTPDSWYRSIRATFIHETKHVASFVARVANNSPVWEEGWLEEGTARHSEELWARTSIYGVAWKGNTGYGGPGDLNSMYCDVRPTWPECTATNPRRPSLNMWRHFSSLYSFLGAPSALSPFGRSASDNAAVFYATSWSLVRYAIDRYGVSDNAFLTALNESSTNGATNLAARSGVSMAELLGRWALALYTDDHPGLGAAQDLQLATWNLPAVYAGLKQDFAGTYTRATPLVTTQFQLGTIAPTVRTGLVGGGVSYFELSGMHTAGQVVGLGSTVGGAPPATIRMAIVRVQ